MQVYARWPNSYHFDRSIYFALENWAHSHDGVHDVETEKGWLTDKGGCENLAKDCCGKCNKWSLAEEPAVLQAVGEGGAYMVANLFGNGVGVMEITSADLHDGKARLHYRATWCKATKDTIG